MLYFVLHLLITAAFLLVVASAVKGIEIEIEDWGAAVIAALVLGLILEKSVGRFSADTIPA